MAISKIANLYKDVNNGGAVLNAEQYQALVCTANALKCAENNNHVVAPTETLNETPKPIVVDSSVDERYVKLSSDLSTAAFKHKKTLKLITWHRLRYLNVKGSGILTLEAAVSGIAKTFDCHKVTAKRNIKQAQGHFLELKPSKLGPVVQIYALKKVCQYLDTSITDTHWRLVKPGNFNSKHKASAELWASIYKPKCSKSDMHVHLTKGKAGAQPSASIYKPKYKIANPISRETLTNRTGLFKMQQWRYEQTAKVSKHWTPAYHRVTSPLGQWGYKPMKQQIFTKKSGHYEIQKRLGNVYHSKQHFGSKGMLGKVRRQLKRSFKGDEALTPVKRYFGSYKQAIKAYLSSRTRTDEEGLFYLINNNYRKYPGRLEFCYVGI